MPIEKIEDIDDGVQLLTLSSGDVVELRYEDNSVTVFAQNERVGSLNFRGIEIPSGQGEEEIFRLTHAFIEGANGKYKRQGIGTQAFIFFRECAGMPKVELPKNDGIQKPDGSHLVGDGPGFVDSLRRKVSRGEI